MKLALGTVQFGIDYGVSNRQGQVTQDEVKKILTLAKNAGINTLDCASAYGNSEQVLGALPQSRYFDIVSKIPQLPSTESSLMAFFEKSINHLKRTQIDTLLFHDVNTLLQHPNSEFFCQEINQLKTQKKVKRIGVSVYAPEQIAQSLNKLNIDVVQAPLNIFDQRLNNQSTIQLLKQHKVSLHIRSVFLQGLLLMERDTWPDYFNPHLSFLTNFDDLSSRLNTPKLTLALAFLVQNSLIKPYIEKIIVGCCSQKQLEEIIQSYHQALELPLEGINWDQFSCNQQALINPSHWPS